MTSIAGKIGFTAETLRRSVRREERDAGRRAGPSAEIEKTLKYVQQLSRTIEQEMNTVLLDCTRARRAALRKMGPRGVTRHRPLPQALSTARFGMPTGDCVSHIDRRTNRLKPPGTANLQGTENVK